MDYKHSKETISQDSPGFGDKSERAELGSGAQQVPVCFL